MTGTVIFVDTETTSLRPCRRVWELGYIIRRAGSGDRRVHRFIFEQDLNLGCADLASLNAGGYYDRHPQGRGDGRVSDGAKLAAEDTVLAQFAQLSRGALLAGNVVNSDADVLAARMRACGILPAWHHHLIDVEVLAAGYLRGQAEAAEAAGNPERAARLLHAAEPPWDSEELSALLGLDPAAYGRHTAMGDAERAMDMYGKTMGNRVRVGRGQETG